MTSTVNEGLGKASLDIIVQSVEAQAFAVLEGQPFEVTLNFGATNADEVLALASFTRIFQGVFTQMFHIDSSMISVLSMRAESASAIIIVFSATGSDLSVSTVSSGSTQIMTLFHQEFVSRGLSYAISSVRRHSSVDCTSTPGSTRI